MPGTIASLGRCVSGYAQPLDGWLSYNWLPLLFCCAGDILDKGNLLHILCFTSSVGCCERYFCRLARGFLLRRAEQVLPVRL